MRASSSNSATAKRAIATIRRLCCLGLGGQMKPGDIVVMDNLGCHKRAAINKAIRAKGARRFFLPQYSPDLNPIEQVFAKLKKLLRKAEERTPEGVWRRIGTLLECFSPTECANYFRNSGYAST
jgi:transposase